MSYVSLRLPEALPPTVLWFIRQAIEARFFVEARELILFFPLRREPAHFWHAPSQLLLSVISGVSVTLYDSRSHTRKAFVDMVANYYPWLLEPGFKSGAECGAAEALYDRFRNPLVHALSLTIEEQRLAKGRVERWFRADEERLRFTTFLLSQESEVAELERFEDRPENLPPTLSSADGVHNLHLTSLYWGVRRMIETLATDVDRMAAADRFLRAKRG